VDVDALNKLKKKVTQDFSKLLICLGKGYKEDYEFILEEISAIDLVEGNWIDSRTSLLYIQYYLNNEWQIQS
jgi:hypothetical protein